MARRRPAQARGAALRKQIGAAGFEPAASATQMPRATRLRHAPLRPESKPRFAHQIDPRLQPGPEVRVVSSDRDPTVLASPGSIPELPAVRLSMAADTGAVDVQLLAPEG